MFLLFTRPSKLIQRKARVNNSKRFDEVAGNYDELLAQSLAFYGKDVSYYSEYKIRLVSKIIRKKPDTILEFGCGTGRNIKFIEKYFPEALITGCDISTESLKIAGQQNSPSVGFFLTDELLNKKTTYDVIIMAGVLHHVDIKDRDSVFYQAYNLLNSSGEMIIFEHNPYNPLTVKAVNTCSFDEGAILLKPGEILSRATRAGFKILKKRYTLFFPSALKILSSLEFLISSVPLGGQYFVQIVKTAS